MKFNVNTLENTSLTSLSSTRSNYSSSSLENIVHGAVVGTLFLGIGSCLYTLASLDRHSTYLELSYFEEKYSTEYSVEIAHQRLQDFEDSSFIYKLQYLGRKKGIEQYLLEKEQKSSSD